ncbi:MAG TPA: C39 family peptidase [Ureibacillus sp.]|nr:C39 family peptidase [Ureibacillus sp.]
MVQLNVTGLSQYDDSIHSNFQSSACGPTTVYVILRYLLKDPSTLKSVNDLYSILGGTKIGLFKWRLVKRLQKLLGAEWNVSECTLHEALEQLDKGIPVALKFDKYFTFQWKTKTTFNYHWVPLIGYEIKNDELYLLVHDNGGKNRNSQIRKVRYSDNFKVLSFVKIEETDVRVQ